MDTQLYTTNVDVENAIGDAIEANGTDVASREDYDLPAITSETHTYDRARQGFVQTASEEEFWRSVERHETGPAGSNTERTIP